MKKAASSKKPAKGKQAGKDEVKDELRKPAKLKPLKEKGKKWKNSPSDDDEGFEMLPEDDLLKFDDFDLDDDDDFYGDY